MLNPWTWWWSVFCEVTRLESHHALLSKFSFLQFLEVILFPIFSHHDQCHLHRILQENSWWWNFSVHPSHLLGALFGINASMSGTLSDEPIETRDLGSGAACPCSACAIISIMSRLIWKVGLMRQEDNLFFGFANWLGRILLEKVDTLIYVAFNLKSYVCCADKYYVLLGRTIRSFWLLCSPSKLPALCKHMLQLTHSFRAWACAFTCMKPFWKINIIDIHLKSLKPFSQIASGISWNHQPWHPMVRLCWGAAKGPGSSLWEEPSSRMATWMEGDEGLIEFCNRSQRGVLDLVIELIVFAEILAFLAQGCVWCIEFWSESDLDEVAGKIVFGQKSWAAVLASEKFGIMRTWHAWAFDLTTTEKKPAWSLPRNQEMLEMGEDSCTQRCGKVMPSWKAYYSYYTSPLRTILDINVLIRFVQFQHGHVVALIRFTVWALLLCYVSCIVIHKWVAFLVAKAVQHLITASPAILMLVFWLKFGGIF